MKVLMCGMGSIGQRHVRNLWSLLGQDSVEVLAYRVRGRNLVLTPTLEAQPGIDLDEFYHLRVFSDLDEALAEKPDAVFVTNPNHLHMAVALPAARAGCHLFIEKPLAHSLDRVRELQELVASQKLVCLVAYQLRFHPGLRLLQQSLRAGEIGKLVGARLVFGEYIPNWHRYEDYRDYHAARSDQGGGVVLSQIHDLDYVYSLFGLPERVFALGGQWTSLDLDVDDVASALMEFRVEGQPLPVHMHQDYIRRPPARACEIIGEGGTIVWDYYRHRLVIERSSDGVRTEHSFESFNRNQLFLDELQHFLNCVAGRESPVVDLNAGVDSLRMALAIRRSMQTGEVVALEDIRP